jgi:hypothetical protein
MNNDCLTIEARGDHAYVAHSSSLDVYDISDPTNLAKSSVDVAGVTGCVLEGDYAFLPSSFGLLVVDISDPTAPALVASGTTAGSASSCVVDGRYAYVGHSSGLDVLDITDPTNPVPVGNMSSILNLDVLAVAGDRLFTIRHDNRLIVVDITDPTSPVQSGLILALNDINETALHGDYLYCSDSDGYVVYTISNPDSPLAVYQYTGTAGMGIYDLKISGNLLFFGTQTEGIWVQNISDPTAPVTLKHYDALDSTRLALWGDLLLYSLYDESWWYFRTAPIFDPYFDSLDNQAFSSALPAVPNPIYKYKFEVPESQGIIDFLVSADDGAHWDSVTPGPEWHSIPTIGTVPRWSATLFHTYSQGAAPSYVDEIQLEFLMDAPCIEAVSDVPDDQGGQVRLRIASSAFDFVDSSNQITGYTVWRRLESMLIVESDEAMLAAGLPDGTWEAVGSFGAIQQQQYYFTAGTFADSSSTIPYTSFCVTAHTADPSIWWVSAPDSGYSVDNIAPSVPSNFAIAYNTGNGNTLSWDAAPEPDLQYYRVYRSNDPNFIPDSGNLVQATISTSWVDPDYDGGSVYYKVSATDVAGNESDPASPEIVTSVPIRAVPSAFALHQNFPNPFNPSTTIRYDVAHGGGKVKLQIFDVSGRLVTTLVDKYENEGQRKVTWHGCDNAGMRVATGTYYSRLTAPGITQTKKMVMLK